MSVRQYRGILSEVDADGNVNELYPVLGDIMKITRSTLLAGSREITIEDPRITNNCAMSFYTSIYGVNPINVSTEVGSVTLTFLVQETDMEVGVSVHG